MDSYEATRVVFTRIQTLDPENASKIMGYILLQDPGEKEMIRIAFGPETRMRSLVQEAKAYLGISSNSSSAQSTPSSPTPFKPARIFNNSNLRSPPPPPPSHPWLVSGFSTDLQSNNPVNAVAPAPPSSLSYAAVVNGTKTLNTASSLSPSSSFIYQNHNNGGNDVNSGGDLIEEYQLPDHLSFLNDSKSEELSSPNAYHRRSHSLSDVGYTEETASGLGWRPCLYYARGFCKNGSTCKFLHGGFGDSCDLSAILGSPSKLDGFEQCQEMLRSRAAQQQRLAMASQLVTGSSFPYNNKCLSFLNETQRSALMMGEEFHKFGRLRSERNDFSAMNSPGSRQIYLTFPADSTFREEDVSNYFSIYGPVQDVRIPYQQKRMFGFVTFVYPETVKLILAKGNPHFVCDSRVLVKPYKEKGKVEKKNHQQLQQQLDRCELSSCCSPHGLDSREPFDIHIGPRMFYNQEMILRRKLEEQAEMQQALEIEGRRLMNLQLLDLKNHRRFQYPQNLSSGAPVPLSAQSFPHYNESFTIQSDGINQENPQEDGSVSISSTSPNAPADQERQQELNAACKENSGANKESSDIGDFYLDESSLEHILPDSLFASPTKSAGETRSVFGGGSTEAGEGDAVSTTSATLLPASPIVNLSSLKSCHFEMPRFSSGHGAIEM